MDALFDFLIQDPSTGVAVFGMSQPDVTLALQQPWVADRQRFRRHIARKEFSARRIRTRGPTERSLAF